jgi:hypothetical protein
MSRWLAPLLVLALLLGGCTFEMTSESEPTTVVGNPICPDPAFMDLLPAEAVDYVELGMSIGIQIAFEELMGSVEDRMDEEETGPAQTIYPRAMRLEQRNPPDDPTYANSLGFQKGLRIFLADPGGTDLETVELGWAEDIPEYATTIKLTVDETLDIKPYIDARAATLSEPTLRSCNREDVTYVAVSTVQVEL